MNPTRIHILHLEDDPIDAELQDELLTAEGFEVESIRIDTRADLISALERGGWTVLLADYSLPGFDGSSALKIVREKAPGLPFIFVSGTLGEEIAIEALKNGATDYVIKQRLTRLAPVVRRALREAEERQERKRAEQAVLERDRQMTALVTSLDDIVFEFDEQGTYLNVWAADESLLAQPKAQLVGKRINEILGDENGESFTGAVRGVLASGQPEVIEYHLKVLDGERWFAARISPIVEQDGTRKTVSMLIRDITERKHAENALKASEERFSTAFFISPVAQSIITQKDYEIMAVNDACCRLFGYSREELIGASTERLNLWANPADRLAAVEELQRTGHLLPREATIRMKAGEIRTVMAAIEPISWKGVQCIISSVYDITERKQWEEALRESEHRFRALIENSADAIALIGSDGSIQFESPAATHILGYKTDEMLGRNVFEFLHPNDMAKGTDLFGAIIQTPGAVAKGEFRYRRKDGTYRWVDATGTNMLGDENVQAVVVNYRDITERKQAEERIDRQMKQLSALRKIDIAISSSFDLQADLDVLLEQTMSQLSVDACAVLLLNAESQTLHFAASRGFRSDALRFTELKLGESYAGRSVLSGQTVHVSDLMEAGGKLAEALHLKNESFSDYYGTPLIVKGEVKGVLEIYHRSRIEADSEWLEFMETLAGQAAIAIDNAELFAGLQRANTELERRVAERTVELKQTNIELEHANHAKDEFLANMSHELRTPLNSILGLSETLLEERRGSLNEHQRKSLELVESSGHHLLDMINDILDLSKIEAGKLDYYPQPVSVDDLCRSSLAFIKAQAAKKSIMVTYTNLSGVIQILADARRLKQVLVNLLSNAVKFTPERGAVTLQVSTELEQEIIQFVVIDTGIGIAQEDLQKLFQPFVQLDSSMNRQYDGTGLGLALVQKLIDLHGGSVQVESEVGKGSRFAINLSCKQDKIVETENPKLAQMAASATDKTSASGEAPAQQAIILLAEDNLSNVLTIGEYLESFGYVVIVAHDGLEAIARAEKVKPDLILMDIQMPVMNGLEAIARLRADPQFTSTPIIALTALAMPGDRERCLLAGASEYMSKPVSLKTLRQMIENLLQHGLI